MYQERQRRDQGRRIDADTVQYPGRRIDADTVKTKVGVSMPTQSLQRWNQDGATSKKKLEKAGYEVELQYANNDINQQVSQIENMITSRSVKF